MGARMCWVLFEALTEEQDSDGNLVETWADAFAVNTRMPCTVEPMTGRELTAAGAVQSRATVKISSRWRPGFAPKWRATDEFGVRYNIEAVLTVRTRGVRHVVMHCSTGPDDGGTAA